MTNVSIAGTVKSNNRGKFGQEVVIETGGKYPDPILVEVSEKAKDFGAWVDLAEGTPVAVSGFLKGREHAGKFYTNVSGFKFEIIGGKAPF